jgi:hypothetical protein
MSQKAHPEQVGLELTLYIRILTVLGSTLGRVPGYYDGVSRRFHQGCKVNTDTVPRLGPGRILPSPFQFILHSTFRRYLLFIANKRR